MRVLIDADGCPVVRIAAELCRQAGVECLILCDTAHCIYEEGAETRVVDQGRDSVDFVLVNLATSGDLVITQDYGLASMCLARNARVIDQNGREYTPDNIDGLLLSRHTAARLRRMGKRLRGAAPRTPAQNQEFMTKFRTFLPSPLDECIIMRDNSKDK